MGRERLWKFTQYLGAAGELVDVARFSKDSKDLSGTIERARSVWGVEALRGTGVEPKAMDGRPRGDRAELKDAYVGVKVMLGRRWLFETADSTRCSMGPAADEKSWTTNRPVRS